ncbi:hypothetical protein CDV31_012641 [Fusarium ambrosium]|uniref:Uncharacterized protein n=1 Tax=Fusarium ambrosium TaxID=131363 RepID=A0A428T8F9_9HYPO|nr:hypothetical protein CDV31_012641 [Fusarium ambrosium]
MSNKVKEVDGKLVTNTEVAPPGNWTNDYEEMGGDMEWGEYGNVAELVKGYGLDGDVKPLFAMASYTGEALSLFELGDGQFFLYNAIEGSLYQIKNPSDLQSIVSTIEDESQGLAALEIEEL